mmetsp:Transcript_17720/g.25001  ORF Transcript_17720/g.25001 Transcript_17720/m.25001 type:complete len:193 (-) Transcript_17720:486-1064(-)
MVSQCIRNITFGIVTFLLSTWLGQGFTSVVTRFGAKDMNGSLHAIDESRRDLLRCSWGIAIGTIGFSAIKQPANASYSAYSNREKDWEERKKNGEIEFSNARNLKIALQEVAPMNSEKSKVFCPNGTSAAVSPLMENKCNDKLATPSVFGRTEDIVGNSIPGFSGGRYPSVMPGDSASLSASPIVGGFPAYK